MFRGVNIFSSVLLLRLSIMVEISVLSVRLMFGLRVFYRVVIFV